MSFTPLLHTHFTCFFITYFVVCVVYNTSNKLCGAHCLPSRFSVRHYFIKGFLWSLFIDACECLLLYIRAFSCCLLLYYWSLLYLLTTNKGFCYVRLSQHQCLLSAAFVCANSCTRLSVSYNHWGEPFSLVMRRLWVWVVPRPDEFAYFILGGQPTGSESGGEGWKIYLFTAVWIVLPLVFLSFCLILCYDLRGCQQDAPFPQIPPQAAIAIVACGGAPRLVCEVSTCRDKTSVVVASTGCHRSWWYGFRGWSVESEVCFGWEMTCLQHMERQ